MIIRSFWFDGGLLISRFLVTSEVLDNSMRPDWRTSQGPDVFIHEGRRSTKSAKRQVKRLKIPRVPWLELQQIYVRFKKKKKKVLSPCAPATVIPSAPRWVFELGRQTRPVIDSGQVGFADKWLFILFKHSTTTYQIRCSVLRTFFATTGPNNVMNFSC